MEVEDGEGKSYDFIEDTDAGAISGYVIYKTQAFNEATDAILKFNNSSAETYYWYVGTTKPTSLDQCEVVSEYPTEQTYTNNTGAKAHIFVLTNSDKNVTFIEPALSGIIDQYDVDATTISGYKIFETAVGTANTGSIKIRIS